MPRYTTKLTRLAVIGLSVGALLPATAAAMPINDGQAPAQHVVGQAIAAGGGPGVTPTTLSAPASTGGSDVVSGHGYVIQATPSKPFTGGGDVVSGGGYQFKAVPSDGGIDTGVLVFLGVAVLVGLAALFLVVATKPRTRQPA
jgi:hypothetical protein